MRSGGAPLFLVCIGFVATLPRKDKILSRAAIVVRLQRNAIRIFN